MTFKPIENPAFRHTLSVPIQAYGTEIREVAAREPTGGDLMRIGNPVRYVPGDTDITFDDARAMRMLSALTGIPIEGSLEKAKPADLVEMFWGMAGFFIPGLRKKAEAETDSSKKQLEPLAS